MLLLLLHRPIRMKRPPEILKRLQEQHTKYNTHTYLSSPQQMPTHSQMTMHIRRKSTLPNEHRTFHTTCIAHTPLRKNTFRYFTVLKHSKERKCPKKERVPIKSSIRCMHPYEKTHLWFSYSRSCPFPRITCVAYSVFYAHTWSNPGTCLPYLWHCVSVAYSGIGTWPLCACYRYRS